MPNPYRSPTNNEESPPRKSSRALLITFAVLVLLALVFLMFLQTTPVSQEQLQYDAVIESVQDPAVEDK